MKIVIALLAAAAAIAQQPVGDGRADDTAALQAALDRTGTLSLRKGTYRISRSLIVDLSKVAPASIQGDGAATLFHTGAGPAIYLKGTHTGTAGPNTLSPRVSGAERGPSIQGIAIVGAGAGPGDGIRAEGTIEATFSKVLIQGLRHGIVLTGRNRNVIISDVNIYANSGVGVLLENLNLHQVNVGNSHISYNRGGGIVVRDSEVRNLQIANCDIEANMATGGPPTANLLFDTQRGSIREGAITGCTLQHDGKAKGSANIWFQGSGPQAPQKVGFFSIANSTISDADYNIRLRYARGVNITGNTLAEGYSYNLLVEDSSNITVGPNTMDQNPDYDQGTFTNAVVFDRSSDINISGLHIARSRRAAAALALRNSHHANISGCTILDSDGVGVLLDNVEWTRVSGCVIDDRRPETKSFTAVRVTKGKNNQVEGILTPGKLDLAADAIKR